MRNALVCILPLCLMLRFVMFMVRFTLAEHLSYAYGFAIMLPVLNL